MDLFWAAFIFAFIIICLVVFFDWLNYIDLQRRLGKEREKKLLYGLIPIEVSDSTAPGETLFYPETDIGDVVIDEHLREGIESK